MDPLTYKGGRSANYYGDDTLYISLQPKEPMWAGTGAEGSHTHTTREASSYGETGVLLSHVSIYGCLGPTT